MDVDPVGPTLKTVCIFSCSHEALSVKAHTACVLDGVRGSAIRTLYSVTDMRVTYSPHCDAPGSHPVEIKGILLL